MIAGQAGKHNLCMSICWQTSNKNMFTFIYNSFALLSISWRKNSPFRAQNEQTINKAMRYTYLLLTASPTSYSQCHVTIWSAFSAHSQMLVFLFSFPVAPNMETSWPVTMTILWPTATIIRSSSHMIEFGIFIPNKIIWLN